MRHLQSSVLLMAASAALLTAQIDPPGRVGRLNYREGPVSYQPSGIDDWVDADVNRPLTTGDNVWVGERGRAELHVGSTALRLSAYSAFQFLNLDDQTVQIRLSEGTLRVRLRDLAQDQIFEVDTPNLAFTLDRPGDYRIDVDPNSQTTAVTVRDGEGEVTGGGQSFPVYTRQRVDVRGDDQINYNLASAGGLDEFDQWCATRNVREDQSQSARYVSRDITGYDDLDQYGRWGDQPGYGAVWMPNSVDAGWAPYHDGHWAWIAPWGWTWVDAAPWGFAPYHYGRWASFNGRWGWIPGPSGVTPIYAPALVGWVGGGRGGSSFSLSFSIGSAAAAVGWFPLGPREPYFPSYQVSQRYFDRVNTTNTVINNVTINNYYSNSRNSDPRAFSSVRFVNRDVRNGVTAVPQNAFASGRRVNQEGRFVPAAQLASIQVGGAPAIAPQRESVLGPRANTAGSTARPPANVLSRQVVARTPPPPAPVSFDRQRAALAQDPGRPLPPTQVQQLRHAAPAPSAPVRVVDMGRVRRVQPPVAGGAPGVPAQSAAPQPSLNDRQNGPPGQFRQQPQAVPQPAPPQPAPPVTERQNVPPEQMRPRPQQDQQRQQELQRQQQQQDVRRQPQAVPQPAPPQPVPPVTERQNVPPEQMRPRPQQDQQRQQELQRQQQQQDVRRQPQAVPQPAPPQPVPPVTERQNVPPEQMRPRPQQDQQHQQELQRQQQQQDVRRQQQAVPQPAPPQPVPPVTERQNVAPERMRGRQQPDQQPQEPQRQQQDVRRQQQNAPPPVAAPAERPAPPQQQQQQLHPEVARPPAAPPAAPAAAQPPPAAAQPAPAPDRQQRPDRGKQSRPPKEDDKKSRE